MKMKTLNSTVYVFTVEEICHSLGLKYEDVNSVETVKDEVFIVMVTDEKR
jgi:hypothetical protein